MATGWLGWPPDVAWEAPVSQILLAIEGRVDFAVKTNPFGGGDSANAKKSSKQKAEEKRKADLKAKNEALALKFDMMMLNARQTKGDIH